jgi:hypothetical protein
MKQARASTRKAKELALVAAAGRAQSHPANSIGLAGDKRLRCFALRSGSVSVLMSHSTADYRWALSPVSSLLAGKDDMRRRYKS